MSISTSTFAIVSSKKSLILKMKFTSNESAENVRSSQLILADGFGSTAGHVQQQFVLWNRLCVALFVILVRSMSYVFVSHASEDKQRLKPLIEALALQGVKLWLDRPGHGESHFNLDQDFIDRHGIEGLKVGLPWDEQIMSALREAGAVLACLSRALCASRQVLVQELLLGKYNEKLVACIVDDLPYTEIPSDLGLADASKIQAAKIESALLRKAVDRLNAPQGLIRDDLPPVLKNQWEIVRNVVSDINRILERSGPRPPTAEEIVAVRKALSHFPIGPMVRIYELPIEVIAIFADVFGDPTKARNFFSLAMQIRSQCNPENFDERQILVRPGEVLNPSNVPSDEYWGSVLTVAGQKSRRTLGAFLLTPGAPKPERLTPELSSALESFRRWLEQPTT